jgi:hypothetical protein
LAAPSTCRDCHGTYDSHAAWDTWTGSAMGNSARNPLFLSALTEAERDSAGVGDFCLRCHAPDAWLQGRCVPSNGSALTTDDTGVTCAVCHRMEPSPWSRNGQFLLGQDRTYRGEYMDSQASHQVQYSSWLEDPRFCAPCHDFRNPRVAWKGHEPMRFPEQSTFTEWASSAYASGALADRKTCQDCHMPESMGKADERGPVRSARSSHDFAGGNIFVLGALEFLEPGLGITAQLAAGRARAEAMLKNAATIEWMNVPSVSRRGERVTLSIRVTNLAGHKLPTGYPEGRRAWVVLKSAELGISMGELDPMSGEPIDSPAVYETMQGVDGVGPGHRLALNDTIFLDTRIPPKGMVVSATTAAVGKRFPEISSGVSANYDDLTLTATIPCALATSSIGVSASLLYQSVTKAYASSLALENGTDPRGARLSSAFQNADPGPFEIARSEITITLDPSFGCGGDGGPGDGAASDARDLDASVEDAASRAPDAGPKTPSGGCACAASKEEGADGASRSSLLALFFAWALVRRQRSSCCWRSRPLADPNLRPCRRFRSSRRHFPRCA